MKILKFGGKSLANGVPLSKSLTIIKEAYENHQTYVVVSARGKDTDKLLQLAEIAQNGESFRDELIAFFDYHKEAAKGLSFDLEYSSLYETLKAIQSLKILTDEIRDQIVACGELTSSRVVVHQLQKLGIPAVAVDARKLIIASRINGDLQVNESASKQRTQEFFSKFNSTSIPVITGYIAVNEKGETISLGRNGSNYSATLLANFLGAIEVQNWTNINGFYTADPKLVKNARLINHLSYKEANELAQFGANIIHPKTITPLLEKNIPILIKNSFDPEQTGTLIDQYGSGKGIKSVNVIEDCALISIEGKGMANKVGIDARIFSALSANNISIKLISQASSERSIGLVVESKDAHIVKSILEESFIHELELNNISSIKVNTDIAILAITGRHNYALEKAISGLRKNKIWLHLITNSISGEHISLVTDKSNVRKAVNVVHNHVFGAQKTLNVFALGKGTVGKTFIEQVLKTKKELSAKRRLEVKIVGVANSKQYLFNPSGVDTVWEETLNNSLLQSTTDNIIHELKSSDLENVVIVDNTANQEVALDYEKFIRNGFDIIASNKIANTLPIEVYKNLRLRLLEKNRHFLYETNVGAGLPIIDTIKHLVDSDEEINKINGVFSGSLSYIFNTFSSSDKKFSEILLAAKSKGFTEPDPREDLGGKDVARKLLILSRELGYQSNFEDIQIESLIPEELQGIETWEEFEKHFTVLDTYYDNVKSSLKNGETLRYLGALHEDGKMTVKLEKIANDQPLSNLKESDSMIQIYSKSYGEKPIIIQGAGAGAEVTARGVYSDLVRIGNLN